MSAATRFRKKPVEIEAMQWDGDVRKGHPVAAWIRSCGGEFTWTPGNPQRLAIVTLEGEMIAMPGDWIIKGVQGEFYPCKHDIFAETYDEVTE